MAWAGVEPLSDALSLRSRGRYLLASVAVPAMRAQNPADMQNYERIFKANSPPEAPKPPPAVKEAVGAAAQAAAAQAARAAKKAPKGPTHSHYLQSKVYRALERIKAEAASEGAAVEGAAAEAAAAEGAAAEAAAEGAAKAEAKAAEGAKKD